MFVLTNTVKAPLQKQSSGAVICYHCGAPCLQTKVTHEQKIFCCDGCKLVYEILASNGLCNYYDLQTHPGLSQVKPLRNNKFAYLDDPVIAAPLLQFSDENLAIITLFIPAIHCSSCMWLLEHLYKLHTGITESRINFSAKEVTIRYQKAKISLREIVELLATIGYEPRITLDNDSSEANRKSDKTRLYKLGVAGFCFGNIMLMSFPEYLSADGGLEHQYALLFRIINLTLSIPVVFYAAQEFFLNAWAGLRQRILNIDAPIALAILITYSRSLYEILSGVGNGYLDSMSGIVFFMLVGRVAQERVYRGLSFHRDYKAYFPMAATVLTDGQMVNKSITALQQNDIVKVYHQEIIPADGIIIEGNASIDYSFVTGESDLVEVPVGERIFAGGKQAGSALIIKVTKPVTSSYLTSLWNNKAFKTDKSARNNRESIIHLLSKHFSIVLFSLAALTAIYWGIYNPIMILPSVSAMLIVACPCALLLTATYTNGNLLRIFSDNGLYLRDAGVIEQMGTLQHLVFDKTGTLTNGSLSCSFLGATLSRNDLELISSVAKQSNHPKSRQLALQLGQLQSLNISEWKEYPGKGINAKYNEIDIKIGSANWVGMPDNISQNADLYISIDGRITTVSWEAQLRDGAITMLNDLKQQYEISLLSGDNDRHKKLVEPFFNKEHLHFEKQPQDKLNYISALQRRGTKVAMIGDGLNDAGALQQSDVGITLSDDINNFSPSCDVILKAEKLPALPAMLRLARLSKAIIGLSFFISIIYNIIGISISMRGEMNPMIAAILMPVSTLTIVLITTGASNILAGSLRLKWREEQVTDQNQCSD